MKKVFTTGQVAKICKVAPRTVSKWFDTGRLKGYRIPGSQDRRIPQEQLIRFLKEHGMPLCGLDEEGYKILLVGTSDLLYTTLHAVLVSPNCVIETAHNAFAAGLLLQAFAPKAVVIDLSIGISGGIAIANTIRTREANASAIDRSLVMGILPEDDCATPAAELIAFDVIYQKPFDPAPLVQKLISHAIAVADR